MFLVFYPDESDSSLHTEDHSNKINQLVNKVDALRTSYNYQLEALRDEYFPKISDAVNEIKELVH